MQASEGPEGSARAERTGRQLCPVSGGLRSSAGFGRFGLTDMLYDWNASIENALVRAAVFLLLVLVPVYELFLIVDALVLDTIDFWSGDHAVGDELRIGAAEHVERRGAPGSGNLPASA